ncbi:MAG: DUF1292 domain-containing protein [Bacilli bacterium]
MEKNQIIAVTETGEKVVCDVLFIFDSLETEKSYIVYTDNQLDENQNIKVYASTFDKTDKSTNIGEIIESSEWNFIENMIKNMMKEYDKINGEKG